MILKERLKQALNTSRWAINGALAEITNDEDWVKSPVPNTNHALWIAGHIAVADNAFIGMIEPEKAIKNEAYYKLFGKGSPNPTSNLADYPAPSEIQAFLNERRETLLAILENCTDEDFTRATPEGAPPFMFDVGSVFQMAAWHEGLHMGQLSVIHRMLGNAPLSNRPPK